MVKGEKPNSSLATELWFLRGGGENGALIGAIDWSDTALGPIDQWPDVLKASVGICLNAKIATTVCWGPDLRLLYNDAYDQVLGPNKHPAALGATCRECWGEIWDTVGPLLEGVCRTGQTFLGEPLLLEMDRLVPREETYFRVSYAPIFLPNGEIGGVFAICPEITDRIISERRLRTLIDLGAHALEAKDEEDACKIAAASLASIQADVPFALIYLQEPDALRLRLVATAGFKAPSPWTPETVELRSEGDSVWLLRSAIESQSAQFMRSITSRFGPLPGGPWSEPSDSALILPLGGNEQEAPGAVLVAGLSRHRPFDAQYRSFLETVAGHIGNAVRSGRIREMEHHRIEELSKLDRAKDEFLATVSHELRSPLQTISGWINVLRKEGADPNRREQGLDAIDRGLRSETSLVQDLLEVSRLLAGKAEIERIPVNLADVIVCASEEVRPLTEEKGIALTTVVPAQAFVIGDRNRLTQVIRNLLSNSIKFTSPGGHIEVSCRPAEQSLLVQVCDDGEGIAEEFLPLVFSRFTQANTRRTRRHSGLGLGLAIVRHFVELHDGTVQAASAGEGHGSTFTLRFPLASAQAASDGPTSARVARQDESRELSGVRILLVEDDADAREVMTLMLELAGAEVITAAFAAEALNAFKKCRPHIMISDLGMPDEDGYSLIGRIRALEGEVDGRTPAIALSGYASSSDRSRSLSAGFQAHLAKPVDFELLINEILNLLIF